MNQQKRQNPRAFDPVPGEVYENAGGGKFLVEGCDPEARTAWMTNIKSGWSLTAVRVVQYDDRTIEWDYSKDGHFLPLDESRLQKVYDALEKQAYRETIRHRQRSLVNAMLCCLI